METRAYSILIPSSDPQGPVVLRNPAYAERLIETTREGFTTMVQILEYSFAQFGAQPLFCRKTAGEYRWSSYREVEEMVNGLGAKLPTYCPLKEGLRTIGLFSRTRMEWVIGDYAAILHGITTVPLYDTLGKEAIVYIIRHTGLETVVCSADCGKKLLTINQTDRLGSLRALILMDPASEELAISANSQGIALVLMQDLITEGRTRKVAHAKVDKDAIQTICFTSGTTGIPKGVQVTHYNVVVGMRCIQDFLHFRPYDLHFSYLPLAHMFEHNAISGVTYAGARAVFWTENPMTLFQELQLFRPTIFCSMPRIYKRLYDMIRAKFAAQGENGQRLYEQALELKLRRYRETGELLHNIYDDQVFHLAKAFLGGRVRIGLSGGAPIDKHILEFLRVVLCCPIVEGYGQTEVPGGICVTSPEDRESGHVGGPTGAVELRLDGVEELGYTWQYQDEVLGHCPAGEICVRGPNVFPGYFKEPQLTAEAFDQEGWLHTGDIGILLPHGGLKIVDRRKNLFKLSQGEYVSPEKVEAAYSACSLVAQCWVTGEGTMDFPVVFVVAEEAATKRWAEAKGLLQPFTEVVERADFQQELLRNLTELGKAKSLASFELCRKVKVVTAPWTPDNELITATLKLRRGILKKHYAQEIAQLYAS